MAALWRWSGIAAAAPLMSSKICWSASSEPLIFRRYSSSAASLLVGAADDGVSHKCHTVPQLSHDGFRVRLVNLPRKKNIHRDLKVAFKGVPGLVNIVPVVSGTEKTRDPVCKGLAFVDFNKKGKALRFVKDFSGKPIFFGKVEKQIECKMVDPKVPKLESDQQPGSNPVSYPLKESSPNKLNDAKERHVSRQQEEDDGGINCSSTTSNSDSADEPGGEKSTVNSSSLKQTRKAKKQPKKVAPRQVKSQRSETKHIGICQEVEK